MVKLELTQDRSFDPDKNFWELNPQFKYYQPYSELYARDTSEGRSKSSMEMWTIFFMQEPDEEINIFFRLTLPERKDMLSRTYCKDLDWDDVLFKKCYDSWPADCMDAVKRAYGLEKAKLLERAKLIAETKLTLDGVDENGRPVKGTAMQINTLQKDSLKIFEAYEQIEMKFLADKETARIKGGSKMSKVEKGEMQW